MFKFRMIWPIFKATGLVHATIVFLLVFFGCALIVALTEPAIAGSGNILWFCFQAVTTIGFGDVVVTSAIARIATVILSIFSIFYLAVITGTVVSVGMQAMEARKKESLVVFLDKLEHLDELSPEELAALSEKIRRIRPAH